MMLTWKTLESFQTTIRLFRWNENRGNTNGKSRLQCCWQRCHGNGSGRHGPRPLPSTAAPPSQADTPATEAKTDAPAAAGSVYYLNFKPEFDQALQGLAASYTEKTGVPVKVVTAASGDHSNTLNAQMGKDGAPTIYNIGNMSGLKDWMRCPDLN